MIKIKYKLTNKSRGKTRINLDNDEFIFIENGEQKIINSKPINVTFGITVEEIQEKQKKTKEINKEDN